MGSLQPDPSMLDMANLNGDLLNPALLNAMDLSSFGDDMQMDLGDVSAVPFNSVEAASGTLTEREHQKHDSNEVSMTGVGAGPLPTGFGTQAAQGVGSTLTEFTKRRNWSQRVIEELKDLLYILTADGRFLYLSPSVKFLTGFESNELTGQFINDYLHSDDSSLFIREFNESIATGNQIRFFYRFRTKENKYMIFECHGHPHLTSDVSHMELTGGPTNASGFCRGFFMMARPYPTKQAELLDSLLEHKIENERLQARIAALKREEAEEAEAHSRHYHKRPHGTGSVTPSNSADITIRSPSMTSRGDSAADFASMPPPAKPPISNTALTKKALEEANATARPDSITDKMARYEGSSHVDSIEMLTGLRYREGERSHGISTGGTSPALIRGDAGIDIPADKQDPRYGSSYLDKKPKKVKSAEEYVCTDCGTLDSPEWRKGPNGPKTLCNACGLRWAKKEKKRSGPSNGGGSGSGGASGYTNTSGGATSQGTPLIPGLKQSNSA